MRPKADNYEVLDLWEYDLKTGEPRLLVDANSLKFGELSEAEKARRERMRISSKGIVEYFWSNDGKKIVFSAGGGFVDPKRVGFFGWSYGGYLSVSLALKKPDVFRANVAVAPVLDFALYDTHYTERYLGKPKEEASAYQRANNLESIAALKAKLLVMHGMADDNVLFTNTTLLFKQLQKAGKIYESVTYPGAKHGISGKENQTHVFITIADFFERNL